MWHFELGTRLCARWFRPSLPSSLLDWLTTMLKPYPIEKIRADFPILTREVRGGRLVYLDNAASTLKPLPVIERMDQYYRNETSNVHRGAHYLSEQGTIAYENA